VALQRIEISRIKYPGFYLPKVFWDFTNNVELPYFDYGKHLGSLNGSVLASAPNVFPLISKTIVEFRTYALANNAAGRAGYQQLDVHAHDVLSALFTVEFATLHSRGKLVGWTSGQYSATHVATATEAGANRIILANAFADLFRVGQTIGIGTSLGGQQVATNRVITGITVVDASKSSPRTVSRCEEVAQTRTRQAAAALDRARHACPAHRLSSRSVAAPH
jgi:phage tail tape-measure protein